MSDKKMTFLQIQQNNFYHLILFKTWKTLLVE